MRTIHQYFLVAPMFLALVSAATRAAEPRLKPDGFPAEDTFFPLAVWVQRPVDAARYREIGVNTYVSLWRGPTAEQLDALDRAGMHAITHQNDRGREQRGRGTIIGWMHGDEPDNAQSLGAGKGWGPPVAPEKIVESYKRMKAEDPGRPVLLNLGQGAAWDNWIGRGVRRNHPEDYPKYLEGCDIASFDIYPATHDHPDVAGKLEFVGRGVSRLVEWTGGKKPVWCCIGTTHIHNRKVRPTPKQVTAEVWIAITHGATGIIYFCHEFEPRQMEAGLLAYPDVAAAVKAVNARVTELAPVLNSQTVKDDVKVTSSNADVPIKTLVKRHGGATYVFAVSLRSEQTTGSFEATGWDADGRVEVIGEGRTLDAVRGKFADRFEGYGVHLYRVACPQNDRRAETQRGAGFFGDDVGGLSGQSRASRSVSICRRVKWRWPWFMPWHRSAARSHACLLARFPSQKGQVRHWSGRTE